MISLPLSREHIVIALALIGIAAILSIPAAFPDGTLGKLILGDQQVQDVREQYTENLQDMTPEELARIANNVAGPDPDEIERRYVNARVNADLFYAIMKDRSLAGLSTRPDPAAARKIYASIPIDHARKKLTELKRIAATLQSTTSLTQAQIDAFRQQIDIALNSLPPEGATFASHPMQAENFGSAALADLIQQGYALAAETQTGTSTDTTTTTAFSEESHTKRVQDGESPSILGEASIRDDLDHDNWKSVSFSHSFSAHPFVFATTQTTNGNEDPSQAHVRSISTDGFETQHCEWDQGSGCNNHNAETNGWVALDSASVNAVKGMAAGTVTVKDDEHVKVEFPTPFQGSPLVFVQVQTENGDPPRNVQVVDRSTSGFTVELCQQDSTDGCTSSHPEETVAWWAIDLSVAEKGDTFDWGTVTGRNSKWESVSFSQSFSETPVVLAMVQSEDGNEEALYSEVKSVSPDGARVRYCESDGGDTCDDLHTREEVAWLAVKRGTFTSPKADPGDPVGTIVGTLNDLLDRPNCRIEGEEEGDPVVACDPPYVAYIYEGAWLDDMPSQAMAHTETTFEKEAGVILEREAIETFPNDGSLDHTCELQDWSQNEVHDNYACDDDFNGPECDNTSATQPPAFFYVFNSGQVHYPDGPWYGAWGIGQPSISAHPRDVLVTDQCDTSEEVVAPISYAYANLEWEPGSPTPQKWLNLFAVHEAGHTFNAGFDIIGNNAKSHVADCWWDDDAGNVRNHTDSANPHKSIMAAGDDTDPDCNGLWDSHYHNDDFAPVATASNPSDAHDYPSSDPINNEGKINETTYRWNTVTRHALCDDCEWNDWQDDHCGGGPCQSYEMHQRQQCMDGKDVCNTNSRCVEDSQCSTCGDGVCTAGENGGSCPEDCDALIFVTYNISNGGDLGGISGADDWCQQAANDAGLDGTYKALLSDSLTDAKDRIQLTCSDHKLFNRNGEKVADSCSDLWDGSIDNPVKYSADGTDMDTARPYETPYVWTGTEEDGTKSPDGSTTSANWCEDWTASESSGMWGDYGDFRDTSESWIGTGATSDECDAGLSSQGGFHIYCFEE